MTPLELFDNKTIVKVAAPMVRYSKLAFRRLVRQYDCDLCFTPMIIAESFIQSEHARNSDFSYSDDDDPLIVQFAANNSYDFVEATKLVEPYSKGVDLNCGCPQRWTMKEGYGSCLINKPDLVADVVKQTRNAVSSADFTVSVKIRIHNDIKETVEFARRMAAAGVSFVSVHGRTKEERSEPVHYDAIASVKNSVQIPVVANGDVRSLDEVKRIQELTNCDGVMSARGLLSNPALFAGAEITPLECIRDWVRISLETGTHFTCFHNHLIYMMEKAQSRADRRYFNALGSVPAVLSYLEQKFGLSF